MRLKRSAGEQGSAMVVGIMAVTILSLSSSIAFNSAVGAQSGANRDGSDKKALAAADAAAGLALYRLNKVYTTGSEPCVVPSAGGELTATAAGGDGWCTAVTGELGSGSAEGTSYTYRARRIDLGQPNAVSVRVIATGTHADQVRRLAVTASAPLGVNPFNGKAIQSLEQLTFDGTARSLGGGVASNGNIVMSGNSYLCGDASPGPGHALTLSQSATVCAGSSSQPASRRFVLAPVDQGNVATVNDNGRFFGEDPKVGGVIWSPAARTLELSGNASLTLGGNNYSFCKLTMSGSSRIIVAHGAGPRIYFDRPEACGLADGERQLTISGSARIENTDLNPSQLQIYMLGSASTSTEGAFIGTSNLTQQFAIYAPSSVIKIGGNTHLQGAISARRITLEGNAQIDYDGRVSNIEVDLVRLFRRQGYVECTPEAADGTPDGGC